MGELFTESENGIERRTDFMAHIGQELRFYVTGFNSVFAGNVQTGILLFNEFHIIAKLIGCLTDLRSQLIATLFHEGEREQPGFDEHAHLKAVRGVVIGR